MTADRWAAGDLYEPYVGRWSRRVAEAFLPWIGAPRRASWLDVGCGTGALVDSIVASTHPRRVKGIDASEGFLATARERVSDPRVSFEIADRPGAPDENGAFECGRLGLVLNFVPSPSWRRPRSRACSSPVACRRLPVDYAGKMQLMRHFWNAAVALDPAARDKDEGRRFPLCEPEAMRRLWEGAGFRKVEVAAIDIETTFRDFDDYWTPFLSGQAPAPGYCMSLSEDARARLRERLRESLPYAIDGSIPMVARAWAVCGRR
jgi:SAM-dependent methyltransferase